MSGLGVMLAPHHVAPVREKRSGESTQRQGHWGSRRLKPTPGPREVVRLLVIMPLYSVAPGAHQSVDGVVTASLDFWWDRDGIGGHGPVVAACKTTEGNIKLFTWVYDDEGGVHKGTSVNGPPGSSVEMSMLKPREPVVAFENADGKLQVNCYPKVDERNRLGPPTRLVVEKWVSAQSVSTFVDVVGISHLGDFVVAFADGDNNIRAYHMKRPFSDPIEVVSTKVVPPLFTPPPGNVAVKGLALVAGDPWSPVTATMQSNQFLRVHDFGVGIDGTWSQAQMVSALDLPSLGRTRTLVAHQDPGRGLHITSWARHSSEEFLMTLSHEEMGTGSWIVLTRVRDYHDFRSVFATIAQLDDGLQVDVWDIDIDTGEFTRRGTHLVPDVHWARASACRSPHGILTACVNSDHQLELRSWSITPRVLKAPPIGPIAKRIP